MSYDEVGSPGEVQGTGAALSRRHWKDSDQCRLCGTEFKLFKKKHHCRHCGEVVCADCSKSKFLLETHNGTGKQRVCRSCAEKYEADKEHPLYTLLGDKLGEIYFYTFMRNGDDDVDQICELGKDKDLFDVLLERNKVLKTHKSAILERIKQAGSTMGASISSDEEEEVPCGSIVESGWRGNKKASMAQMLKEKASLEAQIKAKRAEYKESTQKNIELVQLRNEIAVMKDEQRYRSMKEGERVARGERAKEEAMKLIKLRKRDFDLDRHHYKECELCNFKYSKKHREHHCRNCYRSVCGSCSSSRHGGQEGDGARLCDWCHCERVLESRLWMQAATSSLTHRAYWSSKLERLAHELRVIDAGHDENSKRPAAAVVESPTKGEADRPPTPKELDIGKGLLKPQMQTSVLDIY
eukprot:TRINITY_DN1641_c6_g2_i2.p1 TRINITY_DN1641_c6_g2~~TRINITY_DN1641_c6_g2_i2.p1  ORF type:complete len:411 (+),score=64.45 TRINITY_DN1641_c6_g2_i2:13-1245(+)